MLHSSRISVPSRTRQRFAVRTIFPTTSFSPPDSKEPLRRGILFSTIASILLLIGCILTWLGFNDVFGGKMSMTGPLLITLAVLMMLMSCRQFLLFKKRNRATNSSQGEGQDACGVTAVVVDQDDGNGAATLVMDTYETVENGTSSHRICDDLAPPAYTDVAQPSCSSNCPSFISHDDRNEAPPSYEETCPGVVTFGSESSLSIGTHWRRSSSQLTASPSPRQNQNGRGFFDNDNNFNQKSDQTSIPHQRKTSDTLCPMISVPHHQPKDSESWVKASTGNILTPSGPGNLSTAPSIPFTHTAVNIPGTAQAATSSNNTTEPASWSRKSFSSIPSYTCLLSESGEVSAQVFNTSSIIEEMMPSSNCSDTDNGAEAETMSGSNLMAGSGLIPIRSHSMSSVHALRQGVPYDYLIQQQSEENSKRPVSPCQQLSRSATPQDLAVTGQQTSHRASSPTFPHSRCSQRSDPGAQPKASSFDASSSQWELDPVSIFPSTHRASAGSLGMRTVTPDAMSRSMEETSPTRIFVPERRKSHQNIGIYIKHQDIQETI